MEQEKFELVKEFIEFYIWMLERERKRLIDHYRNNAFEEFKPEFLPEDRMLSREHYQHRFENALQYHKVNYERVMILDHQLVMMKSILDQLLNPSNGFKLNHYYGLYEAGKLGFDPPDFDYHNREYGEK